MKNEETTIKSWSTNSKITEGIQSDLRTIDLPLLLTVTSMLCFGLIMVYSSSYIYAQERTGDGFAFIKKQLIFSIAGFILLFSALRVPYRKWAQWAYQIAGFSIFLLLLVLIPGIGSKVLGAQRWIRLGIFSFQPGEVAKFAMILFAARQLEKKQNRLSEFVPGVCAPYLAPAVAMLLLLLQPDFGTTVIIAMSVFILLFTAGVSKKFLVLMISIGGGLASLLIFSSPYRLARLMTFLDPWKDPLGKGFQVLQSMLGMHNGSFWGVGLGNGKEKLFYLPEAHNDFIFAVIGEELGFLGVTAVASAYLYFIYRGLKIAHQAHTLRQDLFGALVATGITLSLGIQAFINMSVVLGLLPTKGLTLPFISYGGSALLIDLAAIGILLSISRGDSYKIYSSQKNVDQNPVRKEAI